MPTKRSRLRKARQHLKRAREQWDQAAVHSWEPSEPAECITKCFYAFENALTAATTALGVKLTTKHYEKVALARQLADQGKLKTDIGDRLAELNDLRKDVQYGEPGSKLVNADLETILSELEDLLDEAQGVISEVEGV